MPDKLAYERLEMRAFRRPHGIDDFAMNPHFPVNTLAIMRGAVAAQGMGLFEAYVEAMFAEMWEERRKLDDPAVLAAALDEAGLPAAELLGRGGPERQGQLIANTRRRWSGACSACPASSSATRCTSARTGCARWRRRFFGG